MLRSLNEIIGYRIEASDGELGRAKDFSFDDLSWVVRYLVVDTGGFEPTAIIDYSDPDALKKAILHYEILGKPLAVRDESEQTRAF